MPEYDADTSIEQLLRDKKASIVRAPLPPGSPSWSEVRRMVWGDIEAGARQNPPGFKELRKLLTNRRFEK